MKKYLTLIVSLSILLTLFVSLEAMSMAFNKDDDTQRDVEIHKTIGDPGLKIISAQKKDIGTSLLKVKGIEDSFITVLENIGGQQILSYQLMITRHIPFNKFDDKSFKINGIKPLMTGEQEELVMRIPRYFRADAYYDVAIVKVLYADRTEWVAPDYEEYSGSWKDVKDQIDTIGEDD